MKKIIFISMSFLLIVSVMSCKTSKKTEGTVAEAQVEERVETVEEEERVLDKPLMDTTPAANCSEDWTKKEREIIYKNDIRIRQLMTGSSGIIYVIATVNRDGIVTNVKLDRKNTTVVDKIRTNMALELVDEFKFEPSTEAPVVDCGTIKFNLNAM